MGAFYIFVDMVGKEVDILSLRSGFMRSSSIPFWKCLPVCLCSLFFFFYFARANISSSLPDLKLFIYRGGRLTGWLTGRGFMKGRGEMA